MNLHHPRNTTDYKLGGTVNLRRASKKKQGLWGTNLQNPSKAICEIYHADPGMLLVQCDQAGADAKIVSFLTTCGNYRLLFINKIKPHIFVALHLFPLEWKKEIDSDVVDGAIAASIPELKKTKDWSTLSEIISSSDNWPAERRFYFVGKKVGHSSNYGMRATTFRKDLLKESGGTIAVSNRDAEYFLATYHRLFPEIEAEFHAGVRDTILNAGRTLRTFQGFPRYFGGIINDKFWREAYSFIPAGTVAAITERAIIDMQNYIEDNNLNWHMLNDKHDSMLIEAPEAEALTCAKQASVFMQQNLISHRDEALQMGSGVSVGYNWAPYKKDKNPHGLQEVRL